ncbi:MAG: ABC transporter substrate-binding protein [Gaiellales bacterium]
MIKQRRVAKGGFVAGVALLVSLVLTGLGSSVAGAAQSGAGMAVARSDMAIFDIDAGKPADPTNFNPYGPNTVTDGGLTQAVFEPLFVTNLVTGKQDGWLATGVVPLQGAKVWRLSLRKGITWSDGKPFTADDVVFTVQLLQKNPDLNSPNKFPGVRVSKVNTRTVQFTLEKADPRFALSYLSGGLPSRTLWVLPKHIWSKVADPVKFTNYDPAKGWPVGTGAYPLKSAGTTSFTYGRNPKWWGKTSGFRPLPAPKELRWVALGTEETRAAAMASNDLDTGSNFSVGAYLALAARNNKIGAWSSGSPYGFVDICPRQLDFNTQDPVWSNPRLRWAVSYAINRRAIINVVFQGASEGSLTMLPAFPGLAKYPKLLAKAGVFKQYPITTTSAARARQAIESQGYTLKGSTYQKAGSNLSLEITTFDDPNMVGIASTIAEQLRQVGIDASVRKQTIPNFIDSLLGGKFEANVFFGACGSTVDPWQSMDAYNVSRYVPSGQNAAGFYSNTFRWNTPAATSYSKVVNAIGQAVPGSPKIGSGFVQAMKIWYSELPSIPLIQYEQINPTNSTYWTGWPTKTSPYVHPGFATPAMTLVIHNLKRAR